MKSIVLALFCLAVTAASVLADKPPVDTVAEARFRDYFGFQPTTYATPETVAAMLKRWFKPGTSLQKIKETLAKPGELRATWDVPGGPSVVLWEISYSFTDVWDGKKWIRNYFCIEITFNFDPAGKLRDITGRWIMFSA